MQYPHRPSLVFVLSESSVSNLKLMLLLLDTLWRWRHSDFMIAHSSAFGLGLRLDGLGLRLDRYPKLIAMGLFIF